MLTTAMAATNIRGCRSLCQKDRVIDVLQFVALQISGHGEDQQLRIAARAELVSRMTCVWGSGGGGVQVRGVVERGEGAPGVDDERK